MNCRIIIVLAVITNRNSISGTINSVGQNTTDTHEVIYTAKSLINVTEIQTV